jgi:hypothetical protein
MAMSDWNELRKWASEAGVYKVGMKADEIRALRDGEDHSAERGRADVRQERARDRRDRTPMSGLHQKLAVMNKDPNFYYHWFKDADDRIQRAMRAGFDPVMEDGSEYIEGSSRGQWVSKVLNKRTTPPEIGYLMKQRIEWHDEDQAAKARQIDEIEQGINSHNQKSPDGSFVPKGVTYGESRIINQFKR